MGILNNGLRIADCGLRISVSRRTWLASAMTAATYSLLNPANLQSAIRNPQSSDAWPQFRGNYNLTGVSPSTINANLKQMWSLNAGEIIESSAAIADATVYVGTGSNSNAGELIAVDLWSGKPKWKYKTKEAVGESSPAVANGLVFVGDLEGTFHAVNATNGQGLWTYKSGGEIKCSPVIVGDKVLIGSYDGSLYCFEARSGKTIWQFKTENYVHGTPCIVDGIAYFGGCDEIFHGIRISDGKEVTHLAGIGNTGASVTILNTPAGLQAFFGNFANEVLSINLKTRRRVWRYMHPQRQFPFYSSTAVIDGKVILGGRDKVVHCLNAANGKELWSFRTNARVESSPAIAGGRVYIGSNDGRFYVLDLNTGAKVWEFNAGAAVSASPAIAGGRVVIGAQDGKLYCFG
ncbi:MAG: PQQ-binding-like beta-propeller repeat protein [Acidobacteria bacterium]|nr:PQQ-binding-like beta-propeller repeat protein [Acidobacteriota bacterium]MBI3422549.1 PQQ-binding-like beta-propeller repeat protein [Acidobacteriota bacterium]